MESVVDLLGREEGKTLEFKRDLSSPDKVLRTMVAFANGGGGILVIGVSDGERRVIGLADPRLEEERLANLVSNGIKYNQSATPCVEIGTTAHADEGQAGPGSPGQFLTLYVKDNGIGIDPRQHERIFQLFRRLHSQDEYEGTGVGLAICNKITQAHGGRIWVESTLGLGATFFVTLPRAASTHLKADVAKDSGNASGLLNGLHQGKGGSDV